MTTSAGSAPTQDPAPSSDLGPGAEQGSAAQPEHASRPADIALAVLGWVLLGLFAGWAVASVPLQGSVFLATEIMGDSAPWQSALQDGEPAPNPFVGDTIDAIYPWADLVIDSVKDGDFPEWSPYGQGGYELAGLPNSGAYSPLSLPLWLWPGSAAMAMVKLLEIAAVTLGMSLFLRRLGLPQATWPLASLLYLASGFMIVWTNWPQTRVAAFIPLLLWATDRAVVEARARDAVPLGAIFAATALGGFPAVLFYGAFAAGGWALVRAVQGHGARSAVRGLMVFAGGAVLGALLAAWQLVPFAMNAVSVIDVSTRDSSGLYLPTEALASMFFPNIAGGIDVGSWVGHPVEILSYVGMAALLLVAVLPLVRLGNPGQRLAVAYFGVGTLLLLAAVYFGGPALRLVQLLPTIDTSPTGRLRVLVGFFVAVLAAVGFGAAMRGRDALVLPSRAPKVAVQWLVRVAASAAVLLGAVLTVRYAWSLVPSTAQSQLAPEIRLGLAIAVATVVCLALALLLRPAPVRLVALGVVSVLILVPAVSLARQWWPPSASDTFYPETPAHEYLAENLGAQRFEAVGRAMAPGTNAVYRIASLGGRGFSTKEWRELLQSVDPGYYATRTYARLTPEGFPAAVSSTLFDRLGLGYLVLPPGQPVAGDTGPELGPAQGFVPVPSGAALASPVGQGPLRGATVRLNPADDVQRGVRLTLAVIAASGEELATASSWFRAVRGDVALAVPGEGIGAGQLWTLRLTVAMDDGGSLPVQVGPDGGLWAAVTRPMDDGLRVVHAGDATIYQRAGAAETVRWANAARVEADPAQRIALLNDPSLPLETVVLNEAAAPSADAGSRAEMRAVATGDGDVRRFDVTADGAGWLVIADSLRRSGWSATVDGAAAELVPAEHAAGAVFVPAGSHTIDLRYRTPGLMAGTALTAVTLLLLAGSVITAGRWGSVRREPSR